MIIALSMRMDAQNSYKEMRDVIDQRWYDFAKVCGFTLLLIPNHLDMVQQLLQTVSIDGFILSGGNEVNDSQTIQRDIVEDYIFKYAMENHKAIIGVCRGMQALGMYFGVQLTSLQGHVGDHTIIFNNGYTKVTNSFHNNGFIEINDKFNVLAYTENDYCIESISHKEFPFYGIMWHPERYLKPQTDDVDFFKIVFKGTL